jgi:hypothetical protein
MQSPSDHIVYSKNVIEFATVAKEYCSFTENAAQYGKKEFIGVSIRLLPLLYLKAVMLPDTERVLDDPLDTVVDEFVYTGIRENIADMLTSDDEYLEVFNEDFQRSETPVLASISEDMADIYQDLRNFISSYKIGIEDIMNDALFSVNDMFKTYWGQKLLNCLRALHNVNFNGENPDDEEITEREDNKNKKKSNWYSRFRDEWDDETI